MKCLSLLGSFVAALCAAGVAPAFGQVARTSLQPMTQIAAWSLAELHGVVLDDRGDPVPGAVVSALGATTLFAVSDEQGRFTFRNLTPGPYLVRAHLQGYVPAHGRITQVVANGRNTSRVSLARRDRSEDQPEVLEAGVGGVGASQRTDPVDTDGGHDHSDVAWRLRHLKRSVLRDVGPGFEGVDPEESGLEESFAGVGRAVGTSARFATALFAEIPFSGQINLLTTTSFDRPQDLFTQNRLVPRGVAQAALLAPTAGGEWSMRGAVTQGDLSSWILAGAYQRVGTTAHLYEAGMSYGMQRYLGGNADALAAVTDGSRNVGSVHAFDHWAVNPQVTVGYGAKYARYDYLPDRALFSPRASVTLRPSLTDSLRIRALVARRETAPGAEEFMPPSTGVWLPPERTFSPISSEREFIPERLEHLELAAERESVGGLLVGVRAFRQHVDDQIATMFGVSLPGKAPSNIGHYYVGSAGDFEARGWGVSVSREFPEGIRASIDYTHVNTRWMGGSPDAGVLAIVAASALREDRERHHDLTTSLESVVPITETRVFVLYKINTAFASSEADASAARAGARFDVQVNQGLPFMKFTSAQWEMLVAVRNLFREELLDSSVYDELLVVRPPTRIVGGLTVKF